MRIILFSSVIILGFVSYVSAENCPLAKDARQPLVRYLSAPSEGLQKKFLAMLQKKHYTIIPDTFGLRLSTLIPHSGEWEVKPQGFGETVLCQYMVGRRTFFEFEVKK